MKRETGEKQASFDFGENIPERPTVPEKPTAKEREPDAAVMEAQVRPKIEENDECRYCGAPYESEHSCRYCENNHMKLAYLEKAEK